MFEINSITQLKAVYGGLSTTEIISCLAVAYLSFSYADYYAEIFVIIGITGITLMLLSYRNLAGLFLV